MMKKMVALSTVLLAVTASFAIAANSSFQQTCSNITFVYSGNLPALQATCLRANGTPNPTSLVINGISNQNGRLTNSGGASTFQQSCGNIQINVTPGAATLSAFCRTISGASNSTSIALDDIGNNNGTLSY